MLRMCKRNGLIRHKVATHTCHMQKLKDIQAVHNMVALRGVDLTGSSQVLGGNLLGGIEIVVPLPRAVLLKPHLRLVRLEAARVSPTEAHKIPHAAQRLRLLRRVATVLDDLRPALVRWP